MYRFVVAIVALLLCAWAVSAQTLRLPPSACAEVGAQGDGFEDATSTWPSLGVGGLPGSRSGFIAVPGFEAQANYAHREFFYFVPELSLNKPMPLVVVLHGTAGSPARARNEARVVRDLWVDAATRYGFAVLSPVAGGSQGSWVAPTTSTDAPTDYDVIAAAMHQIEAGHNIERARRYLWGFSSGGHVALDLLINPTHAGFGRRQFAAITANAGVLAGLACAGTRAANCDSTLRSAFPRLPLQVMVGDVDPLVGYGAADASRFRSQGWADSRDYRLQTFGGGHWVELTHPELQWQWLCQFSRRLDPIERFRLRPYTP